MKIRLTPALLAGWALAPFVFCSQAAAAPASADAASAEAAFNDAMAQYSDCRWADAYSRFAVLAEQGHAEAARIALLMLRHGPALYRHEWSGSPAQVTRWATLAARSLARLKSAPED